LIDRLPVAASPSGPGHDNEPRDSGYLERTKRVLHGVMGILLIVAALLVRSLGHRAWLDGCAAVGCIAGLGVVVIGWVRMPPWLTRVTSSACLAGIGGLGAVLLAEGAFRAAGYDFSRREEAAWHRIPPYYQKPTVPVGDAYFRRPGYVQWRGNVLGTRVKQLGISPNPYAGEAPVTVTYDGDGFRNPPDLADWRVVVAGDSFVEAGYLPDGALVTAIMAKALDCPVKNLGTSYTGPLTQICYLRHYGWSRHTEDAVLVFFEGNDLADLMEEHEALLRWQQTGERERRAFALQPSLLKALYKLGVDTYWNALAASRGVVNAVFQGRGGEIPLTVFFTPPGSAGVSPTTQATLDSALEDYRRWAAEKGVRAWLAYMPCKRRVLDGKLRFLPGERESLRRWVPTDLPVVVRRASESHGIGFIDLTESLVQATEQEGTLLFNSVYDPHLNAEGCRVVGEALAHAVRLAPPSRN
jgi:hypothetical protein